MVHCNRLNIMTIASFADKSRLIVTITTYVVFQVALSVLTDRLLKKHDFPLLMLSVQFIFMLLILSVLVLFVFHSEYSVNHSRFWIDNMTLQFYIKFFVPIGVVWAADFVVSVWALHKDNIAYAELMRALLPSTLVIFNVFFGLKEVLTSWKVLAVLLLTVGQFLVSFGKSKFDMNYIILSLISLVMSTIRLTLTEYCITYTESYGLEPTRAKRFEFAYEIESFSMELVESSVSQLTPDIQRFVPNNDISGVPNGAIDPTVGGNVYRPQNLREEWRMQIPAILALFYFLPITTLCTIIGFFVFELDDVRNHGNSVQHVTVAFSEFAATAVISVVVYICEFWIIGGLSAVAYGFVCGGRSIIMIAICAGFYSYHFHILGLVGYPLAVIAVALFVWAKTTHYQRIQRELKRQRLRAKQQKKFDKLRDTGQLGAEASQVSQIGTGFSAYRDEHEYASVFVGR